MTGIDDWNRQSFKEAEDWLSLQGHTVLNPAAYVPIHRPELIPHEAYMKIALAMLDACEAVYMLKGWQQSKGAMMEHDRAEAKGKVIMYEEGA